MKKCIAFVLAALMLVGLCACGQAAATETEAASAVAATAAQPSGGGTAAVETAGGSFVYEPYWEDGNVKTAVGGEILFFGDIHDYEDDYFYYDAATGETRGVFTYLVNNELQPGLYACIGDYLQQSHDITEENGVFAKCAARIRAYAGEDIPFVSVMGNHEYDTAAADGLSGEQVFEKTVGSNNYGLAAVGVDEEDADKVIYYLVNFGTAHVDEIDEANTRANATNKYWVNPDQIAALDETLQEIYGENGEKNEGVPTFINAHLPVHYYTDERSAENNCDLLTVLNKYPYVVYVWGHDHSEKDPFYGTVKLPGDTIMPSAGLEALNSAGESAAQEINFTYISCGVVRGNQISDNADEDSERALYVTVDGSKVSFEYCGRDGEIFDRTQYTDLIDATYFEDFTTLDAASAAGLTVDLAEVTNQSQVQRADFFLARPVAGEIPGGVKEFSDRYEASVEWLNGAGEVLSGSTEPGQSFASTFEYGQSYTARITLTGDVEFTLTGEDVYLFDLDGVTIPGGYIASKAVSAEQGKAVIDITFAPTAAMADTPIDAATEVAEGNQYVIASDTEQYLFTIRRADCVAENGQLLTVPDTTATWSFEAVEGGYALRSSNGQYLTAGVNGPHTVLTPVTDLANGSYTVWTVTDGALHINVGGKDYCLGYSGGSFALSTAAGDTVHLYPVG